MSNLPVPRRPTFIQRLKRGEVDPSQEPALGDLMPSDALDRGYVGSIPEKDLARSSSVTLRIPAQLMEYASRLANEHSFPYGGHIQNVLRHALFELLRVYQKFVMEELKAPELASYLESQRMVAYGAFRASSLLNLAETFSLVEKQLVHTIERGQTMELQRLLAKVDDWYRLESSETWKLDFQYLLSKSAAVQAAVNHVIQAWTGHKDSWKRREAVRWESWWASMTED